MMFLQSGSGTLTFSGTNGALLSWQQDGCELLAPSAVPFTLGLRDSSGSLRIVSGNEFQARIRTCGEQQLCMDFHSCADFPDLRVVIRIRAERNFFCFRPEVENVPDGWLLEWIDPVQPVLPPSGKLFWPRTEGILIDDLRFREKTHNKYRILGFLDGPEGGYYPGVCQMQFLAWMREGRFLYFGAHDAKHGTKAVEFAPEGDRNTRLSLQTFCGAASPYRSDFDYVLTAGPGDWMDACGIYRDWAETHTELPPRGQFSALVRESPLVVIYPVRGTGSDTGPMPPLKNYFPYSAAMPLMQEYADKTGSRIMALLMHWEGTAPWAPPYVWPPFGGEDCLRDYADRLHAEGHFLGVYCSGTAWTQKSCLTDYSMEDFCRKNHLEDVMIRGPRGEIDAVICNGEDSQRLGYDLCLAESWPADTVCAEVSKLNPRIIDYAQFFDQNLGGAFHPCYARGHSHPPVPGPWQTEVMQSILKRCSRSGILLGSEAAAAHPYLKYLPLNDLRASFAWNMGGVPVPGYEFVFHQYICNFMGNQCGISYHMDCDASPDNLLYRIAYAFAAGNLLSVVLEENGLIHWGWVAPWNMKKPEQKPILSLIRKLNDFRRRHSDFLLYGKMLKPPFSVSCKKFPMKIYYGERDFDAVLHSCWEAPDGRRSAAVFVNWQQEPQTIVVSANGKETEITLEPLSARLCDSHTLMDFPDQSSACRMV